MIVYDDDGNLVSETVGGVTTSYLVSDVNPTGYVQVLDEVQNGAVVRNYTYGLERIGQRFLATNQASYYGYDGHGSVRFLTNSTGTVTDTYTYDAFGNLIESTGTTPNVYLFAGEAFDPALGLYYNRARYLDTNTGRFWTADAYEGQISDPPSLHRYTYSRGNPQNRLDPSGNDDLAEFTIANATNQTIQAMAIQSFRGAVVGSVLGCIGGYLNNGDCAGGAYNGALWGGSSGAARGSGGGSSCCNWSRWCGLGWLGRL